MQYKSVLLFLFSLLTGLHTAFSQDIDFNQWQANYMALNPAMTGISNNPRIHFAYRSVFSGLVRPGDVNPYAETIMASYDQRISPKAGYIGISYLNDVIDNSRLGTQSVMLNYARNYSIQISDKTGEGRSEKDGKLNLRFGISLGGFEHTVNSDYIRLQRLYNPRTGVRYQAAYNYTENTASTGFRPNFGFGTFLNYNNIFGGFAIHNIIEPQVEFAANPTTRVPRRYSANIGGFLPLNSDNEKSWLLAPQIVFQRQNNMTVLQPGININKGIVTGGVSYRHHEEHLSQISSTRKTQSINFLLGVSKGMFKAAYSYDFMLDNNFSSPHELSLSVYLGKPREGSEKGLPYYFRKMGF